MESEATATCGSDWGGWLASEDGEADERANAMGMKEAEGETEQGTRTATTAVQSQDAMIRLHRSADLLLRRTDNAMQAKGNRVSN